MVKNDDEYIPLKQEEKEEDELVYHPRELKKQNVIKIAKKYKFVRFFTFSLMLVLILSLIGAAAYMIATCECVSSSLKPICEDGFCLSVNVPSFQSVVEGDKGDFIGMASTLSLLKQSGVQTLFILDTDINSEYPSTDMNAFKLFHKKAKRQGISVIIHAEELISIDKYTMLASEVEGIAFKSVSSDSADNKAEGFCLVFNCYLFKELGFNGDIPEYFKGLFYYPPMDASKIENYLNPTKGKYNVVPVIEESVSKVKDKTLNFAITAFSSGAVLMDQVKDLNVDSNFLKKFNSSLELFTIMNDLKNLRNYKSELFVKSTVEEKTVSNILILKKLKIIPSKDLIILVNKEDIAQTIKTLDFIETSVKFKLSLIYQIRNNLKNKDMEEETLTLNPNSMLVIAYEF